MYGIWRSTEGEYRYGHLKSQIYAFVFAHSLNTKLSPVLLKCHLLIFTINIFIKRFGAVKDELFLM